MRPLKGLACVSLLTLAIAAPSAFAQTNGIGIRLLNGGLLTRANPSTAPGNQQSGQKTGKHRHRSRNSSATGQPGTTPSDQHQ